MPGVWDPACCPPGAGGSCGKEGFGALKTGGTAAGTGWLVRMEVAYLVLGPSGSCSRGCPRCPQRRPSAGMQRKPLFPSNRPQTRSERGSRAAFASHLQSLSIFGARPEPPTKSHLSGLFFPLHPLPPCCPLPHSLHIVNQRQSLSELRSFCVLSALCLIVFPIAFALMDLLPFIISLLWTLVLPSRHLMWKKRPFFAELEKICAGLGRALLGFFPSLSGLAIHPSSHGFYHVSSSPA